MTFGSALRRGAALAATTAFIVMFIHEFDAGAAVRGVASLPLWAVVAALAALGVSFGFVWLRWHLLLGEAGVEMRPGRSFVALAAGAGANAVVPARAGDLVRMESARVDGTAPWLVAGTLLAERLLDGVVLSAWLLAGALIVGAGGPLLLTAVALTAGSTLGLSLALLAAARPASFAALARGTARLVPGRLAERIEPAAASFLRGLATFRSRRAFALALITSAGIWLADLGMYAAVGAGLGLGTGPGGYLALEGIGNLALAVPGTTAGIGSFDYLTSTTAGSLEVPPDTGAAYAVAVHAFTVGPVTLLGLAVLRRALPGRLGSPVTAPARG